MRLAHTMLRITDPEKSLGFYCDFIGLQKIRESDIGDEARLYFLGDGETDYLLELTHNFDGRGYELGNQFGHLAFHVDDLDGVIVEIERRGWWYRESKPGRPTRYVFVKDPDGYDVEILQKIS